MKNVIKLYTTRDSVIFKKEENIMTYQEFFEQFKTKFEGTDVSSIQEHLAFQFNITDDEAGGIFYVEIKDGQLYIEPYDYYDRDACFYGTPDVLMKLAEGSLDPVAAYSENQLGIDGDMDKAIRLKEIVDSKKQVKKAPVKSTAKKEAKKSVKKPAEKKTKTTAKAAEKKTKAADKKEETKKEEVKKEEVKVAAKKEEAKKEEVKAAAKKVADVKAVEEKKPVEKKAAKKETTKKPAKKVEK